MSTIHRRFYASRDIGTTYKRLWTLDNGGFIRSQFDPTATHCVWVLDKRGFNAIKDGLPMLKEEGYLPSNWGHDLLVSAIHLGDGIYGALPHLEVFTEQQLRRIDPDFYPDWVPKHREYRPDGYWRTTSSTGKRIIVLEVELTQKRDLDYRSVGWKYEFDESDIVLWVVPRESLARTIKRELDKSDRGKAEHNFVLLGPIFDKGWQATVFLGSEAGKSINELLGNCPPSTPQLVFSQLSLDTRKRAYISKPPQIFRPT